MGLLSNLPLTRIKIFIAKVLYIVTRIFVRKDLHVIKRGGIQYEVDLREGLDLSLFLFGNFQSHVSKNKFIQIPKDGVILDIGANIGVMALQFTELVPNGKVYAFEPTHYALKKLKRNLALNPGLAKRVTVTQTFITSPDKIDKEIIAYSSWKVGGEKDENEHPVHGGTAMSTEGVGSITLDQFVIEENIDRIDFIKIDTDGHEPDVLSGAKELLGKFRPAVIFEIGQYVMEEKGIGFDFYTKLFHPLGYKLFNSSNLKEITLENYQSIVPKKGTIDILALVKERDQHIN